MLRTTRTVTSRVISCIIIAGLLVAYYIPYYPSIDDRWTIMDISQMQSQVSWGDILSPGSSYRLIRPTSRFSLCADDSCQEIDTLLAVFSGGWIQDSDGHSDSMVSLSLAGYGDVSFSGLSLSERGLTLSMITSSWSGTLSVPVSITTGDGVISFTASGYIDTRWLGSTSSLFDNPYQRVMVDRRFIRQ